MNVLEKNWNVQNSGAGKSKICVRNQGSSPVAELIVGDGRDKAGGQEGPRDQIRLICTL